MSIAAQIASARARAAAQQLPLNTAPMGRGVSFSPIQQFTRPPEPPKATGDWRADWRADIEHRKATEQIAQVADGGWKGRLGTILNSPIGRAAMMPLNVIDYPRRLAVLGVEELGDAVPDWLLAGAGGGIGGLASAVDQDRDDPRSNMEKLKDPDYGYGQIVEQTGNKWVDRGMGFLGDVALDPTTYLGGASAVKYAGQGGRGAAAARLWEMGAPKEVVQEAGRLGVHGLDDVWRKKLGSVGGVSMAGAKIPGSERATNKLMRGANRARARIGDIGGSALRETDEIKHALRVLNGRAAGDVNAAAARVLSHNVSRVGEGSMLGRFKNRVRDFAKLDHQARVNLTHATEAGQRTAASEFADELFDHATADASGIAKRQNYVMHVPTKKGKKLFGDLSERGVIKTNRGESTGRAFARQFEPGGTYTIVGKDGAEHSVTFKDATIAEINEKLRPIVGYDVLEDDYAKIATVMLATTAQDVGTAQGLKAIATSAPDLARIGEDSVRSQAVDVSATARAGRSQVHQAKQEVERSIREARAIMKQQARDEGKLGSYGMLEGMADVKSAGNWRGLLDDLEHIGNQLDGATPEMVQAANLLVDAHDKMRFIDEIGWGPQTNDAFMDAAKRGVITPATVEQIDEGFKKIANELFAEGDEVFVRNELVPMYQNVVSVVEDSKFWDALDEYTKLFKAWATARPGFHVRNAMGAMFMNAVAGVGARDHLDAIRLFKRLEKDPEGYLDQLQALAKIGDTRAKAQYDAITAAMGSGMGSVSTSEIGNVAARGVAGVAERASNNRWLRWNRKWGEWVEGPARIAMALNTTRQGGDAAMALERIARYQFDYSQLSKFDRKMKQFIPFWTFMSRNLPLQLQEMWLNPRTYQRFDSAVRNFKDSENEGLMPDWMRRGGGFALGENWGYSPDLPHQDVNEQFEFLQDPKKFLANFNPALRVPAETMVLDEQMFRGRDFYDDENKWLYALLNMVPVASNADRLSGGQISRVGGDEYSAGKRSDDLAQAWANFFGLNVRRFND